MKIPQTLAVLLFVAILPPAISVFTLDSQAHAQSATLQQANDLQVAPGRVILKLKPEHSVEALQSRLGSVQISSTLSKKLQAYGGSTVTKLFPQETNARGPGYPDLSSIYEITFSENQDPVEVAAALSLDPSVEYAEPRYARFLHFTPNDSLASQQSHLDIIQALQAWNLTQGDTTVVIGIVDSGVDWGHPDLAANIWRNYDEIPDNGLDDDLNGYVDDIRGWDFGDNDNDPANRNAALDASHGTLVAGVAGAVTNNSFGVAGVGFNCRIMPVKVIPEAQEDQRQLIFGFEGVKYAAENGADIINASWGSPIRSKMELDVIQFAEAMGSVVVASAGNENNSAPNYPAAYREVLSVASVNVNRSKTTFSSFGTWVNTVAPGTSILSTQRHGEFQVATGTSFSAPMASGIAALLKSQNPDWTPQEVREQVRMSSNSVDNVNPRFDNQLGNGLLDAFGALTETSPAIRITEVTFDDSGENGNGVVERGETIDVILSATNYLVDAHNVTISLSVATTAVNIIDGTATVPFIGRGETVTNVTDPLTLRASPQAGRGSRITITVTISTEDGQYHDRDEFDVIISPTFLEHRVGNVTLTVTSQGNLGFNDFPANEQGQGFVFNRNGKNLLFEGAVLAGAGARNVSDTARRSSQGLRSDDFQTLNGGALVLHRPGEKADEQSITAYSDRNRTFGIAGVDITQETFSFAEPPNDDFVLLKYDLRNWSVVNAVDSLYFGLFLDWNIDEEHYQSNLVGFDEELGLGYLYSPELATYCGVKVLNSRGVASYRAIDNTTDLFNESNEFTEEKKFAFLSEGLSKTSANSPSDYSHMISTGPFHLVPKSTVVAGFALIGGNGLEDLKKNASAAQTKWEELFGLNLPGNLPSTFVLRQNFPNPFNPETTIQFDLPEPAHVILTIYNILGHEVDTLINDQLPANRHSVQWNGRDKNGRPSASGVYIARMLAPGVNRSIKMLLLR